MENEYELSREKALSIFEEQIVPYLFSSATPVDNPKFFIVGGQPGAGKTELVVYSKMKLNRNYISVDGDLLRRFHPNYLELFAKYGADSQNYTHADCARWSIWAIRYARENKYNVILEYSLRDKSILDTIQLFHDKGYSITTRIMVVTELESILGIFQRYFDMVLAPKSDMIVPRYNSKAKHDETCQKIPDTIESIQRQGFSEIEFYRRSTDNVERIAIPRGLLSYKDYYLACKNYPYTPEEIEYMRKEIIRIKHLIDTYTSSPECISDFNSLDENVSSMGIN